MLSLTLFALCILITVILGIIFGVVVLYHILVLGEWIKTRRAKR